MHSINHVKSSTNKVAPRQNPILLKFPSTRSVLWDRKPTGDPLILHPLELRYSIFCFCLLFYDYNNIKLNYTDVYLFRNVLAFVQERALRLLHRFATKSTNEPYHGYLVGSLNVDEGLLIKSNEETPFFSSSKTETACL